MRRPSPPDIDSALDFASRCGKRGASLGRGQRPRRRPATVAVAPPANNESSPAREETEEADRGDTTQIGEAQPQQAAPEPAEINHFDQSFAQAEAAVATSGVATSSVDQIAAHDERNAVDDGSEPADVSADISEVDAPEVEAEAADAIAAESMSVSDCRTDA